MEVVPHTAEAVERDMPVRERLGIPAPAQPGGSLFARIFGSLFAPGGWEIEDD